ncbi:hypothetical protein CTAYLR_003712 [Chrysophaeum taylorii]|uniref:Phosphatidic acid phosphatase type 2/haloperoxidase domain-containing protein n=1 Tax=Chrysophaeum taylorii TaxID=2483200 RepID=A0AAD7UMB3_9STRA|nr:hypothetical protein CTAYLR_003712 [Chrysophaeum taylorii]
MLFLVVAGVAALSEPPNKKTSLRAQVATATPLEQQQQNAAPAVTRAVALTTAAGFAAIAADVFVTKRVMPGIDQAGRAAAAAADARYDSLAGNALSNVAPCLAAATATACAETRKNDRRRALAVAGSWLALNPVVLAFKSAFHRERPDPLHHRDKFSFPSGHTTNAAFFSASLFAILLPSLANRNTPPITPLFLCALCTSAVAVGRVLTDAHFVSDTLAGASLGIFAASLAALLASDPSDAVDA